MEGEPQHEATRPSETGLVLAAAGGAGRERAPESLGGTAAPTTPVLVVRPVGAAGRALPQTPPSRCLNGRAQEEAFSNWVLEQGAAKRKTILQNYDSLKAQEEEWVLNHRAATSTPTQATAPAAKKYNSSTLKEKLEMGQAYRDWRSGAGATSRTPLKDATGPLGRGWWRPCLFQRGVPQPGGC